MPHVWYFFSHLFLVLVYANNEINSRVASTTPTYYWIFASIVQQASSHRPAWWKRVSSAPPMSILGRLFAIHSMVYLLFNLAKYTNESGFF